MIAVVFDSTNIKSATDNIGTFDGGNPDIRYSIPETQRALLDRYENGEISRAEYLEQLDNNWLEANEQYGTIEQGENPAVNVSVPKAVSNTQKTERFARTILESGELIKIS